MKIIKTFILLIFTFAVSLAQMNINTSQVQQQKGNEDVKALLATAKKLMKEQPDEAVVFVEKALEISLDTKDKKSEADCYLVMGDINYSIGQYTKAIQFYKKSEDLYVETKSAKGQYKILKKLGDAYGNAGESELSQSYYKKFLQQAEKKKDTDDIVYARGVIADYQLKNQQVDSAISNVSEWLKIEKSRNNPDGIIQASNKLGNIYSETNQSEQAIQNYNYSQQVSEENNDVDNQLSTFNEMGKHYRSLKNYDKEIEVRQQSIELNLTATNTDQTMLANDNLEIGTALMAQNNVTFAIPYLQNSMQYSQEVGDIEQQVVAIKNLSQAYEKSGNTTLAIESYKQYVELSDSLLKAKEKELDDRLAMATMLNDKQKVIENLEEKNKLDNERIELLVTGQQIKNMVIYSLIAAIGILMVGSYLIYRSSRQKRRANQMLALKSLRSQMNPHFIFNSLNSVNNFISKSDEKSANKFLSDFSRLMRMVMENSKYDFVSLGSEISILDLYLKLEHSRFENKFDYSFNVDSNFDKEAVQIPPMLIQPFIENSIWHGLRYKEEKGFLSVEIKQHDKNIEVQINDDGIGRRKSLELKTKNQKDTISTGLINIENRVKTLNQLYNTGIQLEIIDIDEESRTGTNVKIIIKNVVNNPGL
ncbi:MAG: hypothetical protein A2W91_19110 [Bacteroidetes bacterium GWF2_38_335]|nr:MAG: hypothetical protein A2W91_19110 [Bacteroidetes bacterium GWF2_38_335]HBS86324.1 hypothetical protein [Bacteroidales bacterium]